MFREIAGMICAVRVIQADFGWEFKVETLQERL